MIAKAQRRLVSLARLRAKIKKSYRESVGFVNADIAEQTEVLGLLGARPGKVRTK
jgi:hypothetical protein